MTSEVLELHQAELDGALVSGIVTGGGAAVVAANDAAPTQWRIPMVARLRNTCSQSRRLSQAGFRCNADVRSHEASDGQDEDQSWLLARKPARVETSSRARHARPAGGSNDCRHHARHPLAAAFGARLLRWGGAQEAPP